MGNTEVSMHGEPSEGQTPDMHAQTAAHGETTAAPVAVAPAAGKRKKRKYSKGLKEIQQFGRSMNKASARVARAVAKGMATYRKRSDKSALKKRDGALRDLTVNLAEGLGKTMRVLSGIPADLAKASNSPRARKRMRRQLRASSRLLRPLR
jgi:hypothetical protein